ncbi:MAG: hypothetical protein HXY40_16075 [Chloroflexi bacterium]|nr:hypothetical protein [Chloroflexota bacterium]
MTPDTTAYLVLGLLVTFGLMGALVGSMLWRYRALRKDEQTLRQLLDEER